MPIKVVFVDLGGVLVLNKARQVGEYFEKEKRLSQQKAKDIFSFMHSGVRTEQDIDEYLEKNNIRRDLWEEYMDQFVNSEGQNETLKDILQRARDKGMLIFFTSNNSAGLENILSKYGLAELPDLVVNSSLSGVSKPDSAFWDVAYEEVKTKYPGIEKAEILVIDDSATNIESAENYGFEAILYVEDADKKIADLLDVGS